MLFATGDELVPPGTEPGPGQIVYSNGFALAALAREEGAEVTELGVVGDKLDETIAAVRKARELGADILVTTGGASVGEYDLVQKAFAAEGMELSFWKIAMRPGRPLMHGRLGAMHVLGLPGNPVSSYVCAFLFLVPLIRRMSGRSDLAAPVESALLGCDLARQRRTRRLPPRDAESRAGRTDRDALPDPGQFHDGAAVASRLSCRSESLTSRPQKPAAAAASLNSSVNRPLAEAPAFFTSN